ncbi:MAG: InlB B-repeat-containing protein, partial [bacterium]
MKKQKDSRLVRLLALALSVVLVTGTFSMGAQAAGTYNTSYESLVYSYGDAYRDRYPDLPYISWMMDFADDQIHGYGTYQEKNGAGNGYELDVVCSTLIYYGLYCGGYNVPEYIDISKDDDIAAARSRILNVRANFCAETMYSKRIMTKAGFKAIPINNATKISDLKEGDIIWIFTKKLKEQDEDDESAYKEMSNKSGMYYHAEAVVEVGSGYFVTVGAHGRPGRKDNKPGDNPAVDRIDEVCLQRYTNFHYDSKPNLPVYNLIYRPTESTPVGEPRPYQPALIQKSRDVRTKISGKGDLYFDNEDALITDTAVIGTDVTVHAVPDEGYTLKSLTAKNSTNGQEITLENGGTFRMPSMKPGGAITIRARFVKSQEEEEQPSGWVQEDDEKSYYYEGEKLTGFQTIKGSTYYFDKDGIMVTGWQKIDGNTYHFRKNGTMRTGWQTLSRNKYYFDEQGRMQKGFVHADGRTWHTDGNGVMQTGWQSIGGKTYYFSQHEGRVGEMLTGIRRVGSCYYYFGPDGIRRTGLQVTEDGTYYLDPKSSPAGR